MNALTQLINQSLTNHNIKKTTLVKQLGYTNVVKGIRRVDELTYTLDDRLKLLPKIAKILKIDRHLIVAAFSDALKDKIAKDKKQFQTGMSVFYKTRLGFLGGLRRHLYVPALKLDGNESVIEEFDKVISRFERYKKRFSDTTGFSYQRSYEESYQFDNDCTLVNVNRLKFNYDFNQFNKGEQA